MAFAFDAIKAFNEVGSRWLIDAYVTKPSDLPDLVYHYTDAAGLVGMLTNGAIWATDYRFLNDRSEFEHTRKIGKEQSASFLESKADDISKAFYREICSYQTIETPDDVFVFSLSEEADDLSQWRGYARDGQGFTIGFCANSLNAMIGLDRANAFFKVEYALSKQTAVIAKMLREIDTALRAEVNKSPGDLDELCDLAAQRFDWLIEVRASANKHKSFIGEKEWRILRYVREDSKKKEIKIRSSGLKLINYVELKPRLDGTDLLPIKRIGIGPGFAGSQAVHAVKALCRSMNYDPDVYYADSPYRST